MRRVVTIAGPDQAPKREIPRTLNMGRTADDPLVAAARLLDDLRAERGLPPQAESQLKPFERTSAAELAARVRAELPRRRRLFAEEQARLDARVAAKKKGDDRAP